MCAWFGAPRTNLFEGPFWSCSIYIHSDSLEKLESPPKVFLAWNLGCYPDRLSAVTLVILVLRSWQNGMFVPFISWLKLSKSTETRGPKHSEKCRCALPHLERRLEAVKCKLWSLKSRDLSLYWHPWQWSVQQEEEQNAHENLQIPLMIHTTYWFNDSPRRRSSIKLHFLLYLSPAHARGYPNVQM
ncbi:hypothetical protein EV401DRAFT_909343 [Pisolithus croceorrhizus]|nr:hypothetical protein EV401DRAFT_909343 [Pisolithus croceorrhizus]